MDQLIERWTQLDGGRKAVVALSAIAMMVVMFALARIATQGETALLYAGLPPEAAGDVIAALDARAVTYEVRGDAIYVDASARDATRLALASDGLPASGGVGYELLDTMSGFGTTSQMFDAAYWRAKEGELARTVVASPGVRAARVHIATPQRQPFARSVPVTASVTVTPNIGSLDPRQAEAIRHLVASAVAGLDLSDVAVIDSAAGVILADGAESPAVPDGADPRAVKMKENLERLLEARVGAGKALVEVNIDADMDSQTITERVIDPASRVAISSDLEETSETAQGAAGGAVTVASNLPAGDADAEGGGSSSERTETRERQNFEVSETRRERVIRPGQIRRISVAVMVDGIATTAADGTRSWAPRPEEEMEALRALVESAVGFDPGRGDRVTLQTLEFPAPTSLGTEATAQPLIGASSIFGLAQTGILAATALILGLFVVKPLLAKPPALPAPETPDALALDGEDGIDPALVDIQGPQASGNLPSPVGGPFGAQDDGRIRNLRELVNDRFDESADVLQRWIEAPDPTPEKTA
ncbi:MAG: flagellar basal-body MS-ring/collar protein FliF [Pseudomonadota bacterium]